MTKENFIVDDRYKNPEPVPPATQLAIMPFLAAIEASLSCGTEVADLRVTVHRVMSREGSGYLQQAAAYLPINQADWRNRVGRIFRVDEGIIGAAYEDGQIWRTKTFASVEQLRPELRKAMDKVGDTRTVEEVAISYLAMPCLGPGNEVVLILYADCNQLNFFADDSRVQQVASMCNGFCRLFDWLQRGPFPNLRNFPLQPGQPVTGKKTVYPGIHEHTTISAPKFEEVVSFNYEASVA